MNNFIFEAWPSSRTVACPSWSMAEARAYIDDQSASPEITSRLLHEASHMAVAEATTWGILLKWIDRQLFELLFPLVAFIPDLRSDQFTLEEGGNFASYSVKTFSAAQTAALMRVMLKGMPLNKKLMAPMALLHTKDLTRRSRDLFLIREFLWGDPKLDTLAETRDGWVRSQQSLRKRATRGFQRKYRKLAEPALVALTAQKEVPERSKGFTPLALSKCWNDPSFLPVGKDIECRPGHFAPILSLPGRSGVRKRPITGGLIYENLATLAGMYAQLLQQREIGSLTEGADSYLGLTNYLLSKAGRPPIHETDLSSLTSDSQFFSAFAFPMALFLVALTPSVLPAGGNPYDIQGKGLWNVLPHHLHPGWRLTLLAEKAEEHPEFREDLNRIDFVSSEYVSRLANHFSTALGEFAPYELLMAHYMSPLKRVQDQITFPNDPLFTGSDSFNAELFVDAQKDPILHILAAANGLNRISHVVCADGVLKIGEEGDQYQEAFIADALLRRFVYGTFPPHEIIDESLENFVESVAAGSRK